MKKGSLIVLSGFSGAGKGTIVKRLLEKHDTYALSISMTTRDPRPGEEEGKSYFFRSDEEFEKTIAEDGFLEYAEYCGNYYGSPKKQAEQWMSEGNDVILEIEVQGCRKIKDRNPDCVSIFIMPPSMEELEKRLRGRGTETEEVILKRLERAKEEMALSENYDYVIVNDTVAGCAAEIEAVLRAEKNQ